AIENTGYLTVTRSTLANNMSGSDGGAIDSGGSLGHDCACVAVSGSTFFGNADGDFQAGLFQPASAGHVFGFLLTPSDGAAINIEGGSLLVWGSTFSGDVPYGGADIESGPGTVLLAGNIIDETCAKDRGSWHDLGYNIADGRSCLRGTRGDVDHGASKLAGWAYNGGPTPTMEPVKGSPAIGAIPYGTTLRLGGGLVSLCPTTDQRGVKSSPGRPCDAGAVQVTGRRLGAASN
ncbi:MAG TPA: choice-of-anchor Q domain-containing protein, partial [Acidimicrobiales bacterium]|nr:choice-of-anchor Q domain-containing protein [Acidimicrobiales bacterium]